MNPRWLWAALALVLAACGASPSASTPPAATDSPPPTSQLASASASPSTEPSEAAERLYPYQLSWPEESAIQEWRYASAAWDGEARVDSGNQYTDFLLTAAGPLFAFGLPTDEDPEAFRDRVAANAQGWHGCEAEPIAEEPLNAGGADGFYGEYLCGGSTVLRWTGVHDGFGLFIGLITRGSDVDDDVATLFKQQVSEVEWTN